MSRDVQWRIAEAIMDSMLLRCPGPMSARDISDQTGLSLKSVELLQYRALLKLRQRMRTEDFKELRKYGIRVG